VQRVNPDGIKKAKIAITPSRETRRGEEQYVQRQWEMKSQC
jgi:hypothetical protein